MTTSRYDFPPLTDINADRIEVIITIPDGVAFADLELTRTPAGAVRFAWPPLERICAASGIDIALLRDLHEDNVAGLIIAWYAAHRAQGGAPDSVAEDLIREAMLEDEHGGGPSHHPGRA